MQNISVRVAFGSVLQKYANLLTLLPSSWSQSPISVFCRERIVSEYNKDIIYLPSRLFLMAEHSVSLSDVLADDETVKLTWKGIVKQDETSATGEFAATDRRLIYSVGSGHVTDIGYDHISSIESDTKTNPVFNWENMPDNFMVYGIGFAIAIFGGGASFAAGNILLGLILWLGGSYLGAYPFMDEDYDSDGLFDEEIRYRIKLKTSGDTLVQESSPRIFISDENIGPKLSKIVQEDR